MRSLEFIKSRTQITIWLALIVGVSSAPFHTSCTHAQSTLPNDGSSYASWRGPAGNGSFAEAAYPTKWSDQENIQWRAVLPGRGASTPIFAAGKIFVTAADESHNYLIGISMDGDILWSEKIGHADAAKNKKASGANSSPVSDGKHVFAYFKSGDLIACDVDGKKVWETNLQSSYGEDTLWWDLGTSPVLTDDAVVIAVMQTGPSFLVALDKSTGKQLWKTDRQFNVNSESNQSYTTPVLTSQAGTQVLVTMGADHLTGHTTQGKSLFSVGGFNPKDERFFRSIASPVVYDGLAICPYARGATLTAIRLGPTLEDAKRVAWFRDDIGVDVPTPALGEDKLFLLSDDGQVSCLQASTGKTISEMRLPKNRNKYSSSPTFCDGKLYCTREDATTFVVDTSNDLELVAENEIEGDTVATLLFVDGKIYLRTYEELICIGNQ